MTLDRRVQMMRAYLSASALLGAVIVFLAFANLHPVYGIAAAAVASLGVLWWWRSVFSRARVVLWLEERAPTLRYSLAALLEAPDSRFRDHFEQRVNEARFGRPLAMAGLKLVGIPLALLLVTQLLVRPMLADTPLGSTPVFGRRGVTPDAIGRDVSFAAIVTTPAYARVAPDTLREPLSVAALVGSDVRFVGRWTGRATMPVKPTAIRLTGATEKIVSLEPRLDSAPRVVLELPARDTVLPTAGGVLRLLAHARDDIGIATGAFELIFTSGSGESFKSRSATVAGTRANDARDLRLDVSLRLDTLGLKPGDILHIRAVARDANPSPHAEAGSSETRTLRVFRASDADSVAIEAAPPPEIGKGEVSQRMLIILAEALVAQRAKISRSVLTKESETIGRDQARLRKRVGEIIFSRLTGEEHDEEDLEPADSSVSPSEALLRAAEAATNAATEEHLHEDSPIVAVNRPLLEAFNAMWDAERRLMVGEPREALPHMRAALAAIQRARAAERLYLRGRPPTIVLDIGRIRLSGKKEGIDPTVRGPRASALAALMARRARFSNALELLAGPEMAAAGAIDSLTLLRVDALSDQPRFAAALARAIEDLRSSKDATASLQAARRTLIGDAAAGRDPRWSGSW